MNTDQNSEKSPSSDEEIDPNELNNEAPLKVVLNREDSLFILNLLNRKPRPSEALRNLFKRAKPDLDP
jgi:hypothetical protein